MNNYLTQLLPELNIIILTYLDNVNINLQEFDNVDIEYLFQYKYNKLYTNIVQVKDNFNNINWKTIYLDMTYINYQDLINIFTDSNLIIKFDIEDKLGIIDPHTFDIIYTSILKRIKDPLKILDEKDSLYLKFILDKHIKLEYNSMYIYLMIYYLNIIESNVCDFMVKEGQLKIFTTFTMVSFIIHLQPIEYSKVSDNPKILTMLELPFIIYNSFKGDIDLILKNKLNNEYYQRVFDFVNEQRLKEESV